MSEPNPDDELEALFARQREVDHQNAPSFHPMRTRSLETQAVHSAIPYLWRWAFAGATALVVALTVLFTTRPHPASPATRHDVLARQLDEIDTALQKSLAAQYELTAWQSPTDFLLQPIHNHYQP
jgi:hypothetical protein